MKMTHAYNPQHLADYKAAIAFFKAAKKSFDAKRTVIQELAQGES